MINYKIINSGSDGNAVVIEDYILIDCGVSFEKLKPYYKKLKIVFLTHIHSDHFKKSTIRKLAKERPTLRWACGEWLVEELVKRGVNKKNIDILYFGNKYNYKAFKVEIEHLYHDVPNCCYKIEINSKKMIYATDTNSLNGIEAKNYDLYLLEGNYNEKQLLAELEESKRKGEFNYRYRVLDTHLSEEKATDFVLRNTDNDNYILEYMHKHKNIKNKEENDGN